VLAFDDRALQEEATLAILIGSLMAGIIGLTVLFARHRVLRARRGATPGVRRR
jgi:Na+/H+ antiporter NhaA